MPYVSLAAAAIASLPVCLPSAAAVAGVQRDQAAVMPPPVTLISAAGEQRAVPETYCLSIPPRPGETTAASICAESVDRKPRRLSVVRPRETISVVLRGARAATGYGRLIGLGRRKTIARFRISSPTTRWRVSLPTGAFELEVYIDGFATADGRTGDTSGSLGLLVDRTRKRTIVLAPRH